MPDNAPIVGEGWVANSPLVSIEFVDHGSNPPNVYFRIGRTAPTLYMSLPEFTEHFRYNHIVRDQNGDFVEEFHTFDHGQPLELPKRRIPETKSVESPTQWDRISRDEGE
jgi:hypothetical protein